MGDNVASVYVHSVRPYAVDYMVRHKDATNWKSTIVCSDYDFNYILVDWQRVIDNGVPWR